MNLKLKASRGFVYTSALTCLVGLTACFGDKEDENPLGPDVNTSSTELVSSTTELSSGTELSSSSEVIISSSSEPELTAAENIAALLPEDLWIKVFYNRLDFYTYQGFIDAVIEMSERKIKIETRDGITWDAPRVSRWNGSSWDVVYTHPDFNEPFRQDWAISESEVDFGKFLMEGTFEQRQEELMALFAQMSHETTGRGSTQPYNGGLMFTHEVGYNDNSVGGYTSSNDPNFQAVSGQSYHGRGPFQISYPYNYGKFGYDIFGDNRGLTNPNFVLEDDKYAFMAAIWFWMKPQIPKPTMHDVILGQAVDTKGVNGASSRFGWTTNIINGGIECGKPGNYQSLDRQEYFKNFMSFVNLTPESNLSCEQMSSY